MCGIVGFTGSQNAAPILLDGLKKLEYRGYDSAGIAVLGENGIHMVKASGMIKNLDAKIKGGAALPGVVQVEMTGDNAAYTRVYLHNALKGKWQFLNSYKDGVITADTAGRYLLTNQNLRFSDINWTFFIAGGVVIIIIAVAYIVIKKRYWFW